MALALTQGSPAGHGGGQGGVSLAAWSVVKEPHGLLKVTIRQLRNPAGLERTLRADGVPANVRFVHHFFQPSNSNDVPKGCLPPHLSSQVIAKVDEKLIPNVTVPEADAAIIRPSALPHGIGLYLKAWAPDPARTPPPRSAWKSTWSRPPTDAPVRDGLTPPPGPACRRVTR